MDCPRIKELLSEYIDDELDQETRVQVERHLDDCQGCTRELAAMKAVVDDLGALERVQAPVDFLDRLHERLEPRFTLRKLIRLFFVPIRVKLPLEFATAAALLILVFASLQGPGPQRDMAGMPEASKPVQLAKKAPANLMTSKLKEEAEEPMRALDQAAPAPSETRSDSEWASPAKKQTTYMAHAPKATPESARPLQEVKNGIAREKSAPTGRLGAGRATGDHKATDLRARVTQVEDLIGLVQGVVVSREKEAETGEVRSLIAEIPKEKYETFSAELKQLVGPDAPLPAILQRHQETLRVRVTFVAPHEETS